MSGRRLVVVGAGPAGMAAALAGAAAGLGVTLVDEWPKPGGQFFRGRQSSIREGSPSRFARQAAGIAVLSGTTVVDAPEPGLLAGWSEGDGLRAIPYDRLVIATGAYDRVVPLPGWTLPGVLTAGGASTLAKLHGVAPGRRMVVAGSGPFLLAVADDLAAKGSAVTMVEATPLRTSARGLPLLARDPETALQAAGYLARGLRHRVRRRHGAMVTAIHGSGRVEAVTIQSVDAEWAPIPGSERRLEADGVALGFGFVPQLDLAEALGCRLAYDPVAASHFVAVDAAMRTSRPEVYAAGEVTGIGGMRVAMAEGRLAGLAAAHDAGRIAPPAWRETVVPLQRRLARFRRLATWLGEAYRPRPGLWALAGPDTILCRCEEVRLGEAEAALAANPATPHAVKTMTRAGMGLCQGRICGPFLTEWLRARHGYAVPADVRPLRARPPLRPVPLGDWLGEAAP